MFRKCPKPIRLKNQMKLRLLFHVSVIAAQKLRVRSTQCARAATSANQNDQFYDGPLCTAQKFGPFDH